jgi:hypothetical protein
MRLEELEQECDDKVGRNGSNDYRCDSSPEFVGNAHFRTAWWRAENNHDLIGRLD